MGTKYPVTTPKSVFQNPEQEQLTNVTHEAKENLPASPHKTTEDVLTKRIVMAQFADG